MNVNDADDANVVDDDALPLNPWKTWKCQRFHMYVIRSPLVAAVAWGSKYQQATKQWAKSADSKIASHYEWVQIGV